MNKEKIKELKKEYREWRIKNRAKFRRLLLTRAEIREAWKAELAKRNLLSITIKEGLAKKKRQSERVSKLSEKFSVYNSKEDYENFIKKQK